MGFVSGFTGGVTLTLGIAYLAVQAHQRNRQTQGDLLRAQTHLLNTTTAPSDARQPEILPRSSRPPRAVLPRTDFIETAKDRWNHEVLRLAQLVQSRDASEAVEEVEDAVVRGLAKAGAAAGTAAGSVVDHGVPVAAESTKGAVASLVDKAKAAVGRAQDKLSGATTRGSEVVAAEAPLSAVERALQQRFESRESILEQSVEEALNERYKPLEEQNHNVLRAL
ncbi:hypothetical protein PpBr36_07746 [Pyricularia pennisetigena]|uniref:hypothetical protein n=1 Tax=Pyricularia pennisetigena TaxID=1578925 RepID=UPI00114EF5DB|nr:hypothetical protein PpBr36_07746 [Pyricularia pennisetigena]TLS25903.1 hypothetical protein PpBr36_07746 [Pyricularia pennisetigena]